MNCYYFGDEWLLVMAYIKMFRGHCNRRACRLPSGCDWLDTLTQQQYPIVWAKENAIYHHIICTDYEPSFAHCGVTANEACCACGGGTAVIETTQAPPTTVAETA